MLIGENYEHFMNYGQKKQKERSSFKPLLGSPELPLSMISSI